MGNEELRHFNWPNGPKRGLRNKSREPPVAALGSQGAIFGLRPGFVHPATSPQGQACSTFETAFFQFPHNT